MSIPGAANPLLLAQLDTGYKITRSLRFNSSDSAYLSRTPASAGNRKTWTWAGWVKRARVSSGNRELVFTAGSGFWAGGNQSQLLFNTNDTLYAFEYTSSAGTLYGYTSSGVFRDPAAWYHIVLVVDTTQATAANRIKLYVNGVQDTATATPAPPLNLDTIVNSSVDHYLGAGPSYYGSLYLADIHFIDGQALTPSSFTEVSATTGQLIPKAYTGTFGTNGFWLKFSDNSAATATTLGKDYSGNGNNWTPNNLSVTAGAGNDSLVDTPTSYGTDTGAGGEVRGNYCTWNPLSVYGSSAANGNLDATVVGSGNAGKAVINGTIAVSSGKWYWEITPISGAGYMIGVSDPSGAADQRAYNSPNGWSYFFSNGNKYTNNVATSYGATYTSNDVIGVALDMDAGTLVFYKNGTSQGTAYTGLNTGRSLTPYVGDGSGATNQVYYANFGQRPFAYTAPSGFKALCDTNLPAPVVAKPNTVFDVKLYTGNGSTQTISGLGFSPDLVWIKKRSGSEWHCINDTVRGAELYLSSNTTNAESGANNVLTAFTSTGYTVGSQGIVNDNGFTFASWCWDAGSSTVTNTQGSITSQVRANASAGFSIVTYTGTGSTATVGHGLGAAPYLMIHKARNLADFWLVYHQSLGAGTQLGLSSTSAAVASPKWNNTAPTSTVFTVTNDGALGQNAINYVTYCFAPVNSYSAFGSYQGNGSSDGPFVFCNFRPAFVLVKGTSTGYIWTIEDSKRDTYNGTSKYLQPQSSDAEGSVSAPHYDFTSNGFKIRTTDSAWNQNGITYIYAAFAESPFAYSRAR